ncbi:hypothetical protein BOTBODRAFT_397736 [Botryobasidium botryosum FD-172 SS1]|uniref:Uncharacterized protein n=1 Tax=Botryobasidium botryosum (strain FD-172 SS1) TaxID=930990 RepID=A0A067MC94_BOTB1|nr:hypothetical protein BOTBODRAFT_397736 [Botryobasidium botryosum FD-172 SS1]
MMKIQSQNETQREGHTHARVRAHTCLLFLGSCFHGMLSSGVFLNLCVTTRPPPYRMRSLP